MAEQVYIKHLKSGFDSLKNRSKSIIKVCLCSELKSLCSSALIRYETYPPFELGQQKPDGSIWSLFELIILQFQTRYI